MSNTYQILLLLTDGTIHDMPKTKPVDKGNEQLKESQSQLKNVNQDPDNQSLAISPTKGVN